MFVSLLPIAATVDWDENSVGQYFCVVEHVAGITFSHDGANEKVLSGKVTIPESDMKFFIKVGPKEYNDTRREICAADIDWIKKVLEKGMPYPKNGPGVDNREWIGLNCFTSSEITLRPLDERKPDWWFRGYGGSPDYYGAGNANWFSFYNDYSFRMGFLYDAGPVIEHGHCTKIEPPK
jgi:hypothetical protein